MGKVDNRDIYEIKPWLNDDKQNVDRLNAIVNGGGSDITVEAVTFTENGTFAAPSGKAYSPVTVNVAGGSGDFSTAEVTILNAIGNGAYPGFIVITESELRAVTINGLSSTVAVPLYKGVCFQSMPPDTGTFPTITGNAELDLDNFCLRVTGDATIDVHGSIA